MWENDIENKNYKAVMVWGIDDGDSVAFIKPLTEWYGKAVSLYLHKSRDMQVQVSAVAKKQNGEITIGNDAVEKREYATHFMRSPESWERISSTGVTYREHMSDYIRGMSEAILQNSSNRCGVMRHVMLQDDNGVAHWQKDEVLLVVSRPSSITWKGKKMRRQYAELISEATGISNVIVTEESRVAVFILLGIYNLREEINLQGGALVLDFGSYTADATYLLPEKGSVNICWELGDVQVECAMLKYIMQSDRWKKILADAAKIYGRERVLVGNDCSHAIFQLRERKKAYFDGTLGERWHYMELPVTDKDGIPIIDECGDLGLLGIGVQVTSEMMQYALDGYEFDVRKDGHVVNHGTWKENCRQFLDDVRQTLEWKELSVQTVIVTGSGSRMPCTVEMSVKAFPESLFLPVHRYTEW
ncbi:MAG: hypothetical protein K2P73_08235 [Lachnospiraceae bacterium]|nr:hypothetical protein [Lachnospiraceae bacterium]